MTQDEVNDFFDRQSHNADISIVCKNGSMAIVPKCTLDDKPLDVSVVCYLLTNAIINVIASVEHQSLQQNIIQNVLADMNDLNARASLGTVYVNQESRTLEVDTTDPQPKYSS